MAEPVQATLQRTWRWTASIRIRTAALATLVVAVALVVAATALVVLQRRTLTDNVDTAVRLRAEDITSLLIEGTLPEELTVLNAEVSLVQVLDDGGRIVGASENILELEPLAADLSPGEATDIRTVSGLPIDFDEDFRVLTRSVETPSGVYTVVVGASLDEVNESSQSLVNLLRWGVPILVLLVAGGTFLLVGRALSPVEGIRREVAGITSQQLARRVPEPATDDEIGRLARTMNEMLDRLEVAQEKQERFVGDASHELRSPLASMRTQVEVDLEHPGHAPWQETMTAVQEEVVRMQRLVEDLLLLARSDAQSLDGQYELLDLDDIVLAEAEAQRDAPAITIDTSGVSAGQVRGDARQLPRLVRNLLENAIRFGRSRVVLTLSEARGLTVLAVDDDGGGVPGEQRERVFERFTRLDSARDREHGGAGLGLAIARAIAEAHGGTLEIEDSALGGARFVLSIPSGRG